MLACSTENHGGVLATIGHALGDEAARYEQDDLHIQVWFNDGSWVRVELKETLPDQSDSFVSWGVA